MEYINADIGGMEMYVPTNDRIGKIIMEAHKRLNYYKHIAKMRNAYQGEIKSDVVVMDSEFIYVLEDVMTEKGYEGVLHRHFEKSPKEHCKVLYAGLHENTDNQHIHLGFFEKEPRFIGENSKKKRYRFGTIGQEALNSFRIKIEERLTDAGFDLKRSRRNLTDSAQDTLFHIQGVNDYERELKRKLFALYRALPIDGRVSYGSKNMDALRPQVNEIVNFIIKNNPNLKRDFDAFCSDLARFDANRKRICDDQKIKDASKHLVSENYLTDIYRRLGEKVIKAAFNIKQKCDREAKKCKTNLAKKRVEKRHRGYLLEKGLRIGADVDDEAINCFEEYRRRLAKANYERLVDEGVIEAE